MDLCKVVKINESKCTNCHICIMVCPIKYCFKDENTVSINDNLCIGCGRCYNACPHGAIDIVDDFQNFMDAVHKGKKITVIISPSIIILFNDLYKNFLTWFKEHFALDAILDEGFGAELYSELFMRNIKKLINFPVISNQCPTIIEYIKIFHPELINNLIQIHSPTIILAKLYKKATGFDGIITFLGPCISKRREFLDPDTNEIIQYNITLDSLKKYMDLNKVNLKKYKEGSFDYLNPERGSVFCKPGGINNIIKRYYENPKILNIEGNKIYEKYINDLNNNIEKNPKILSLFIDILNCSGGCFHGPAIKNTLSLEEELILIENIESESKFRFENKSKAQKSFEKIINENDKIDFNRVYFSDREKSITTLENKELKEIYEILNMVEKRDYLNCKSCGFRTCQEFATAIYSNLNSPDNCKFFIEKKLNIFIDQNKIIFENIKSIINTAKRNLEFVMKIIKTLKDIFIKIKKNVNSVVKNNEELKMNSSVFIPIITAIKEVSEQINLLSLNASIEASRTGETGKGFSVVSTEIRKLADKTKKETSKISVIMDMMIIDITSTNKNIDSLFKEINDYNDFILKLDTYIKNFKENIINLDALIEELNIN